MTSGLRIGFVRRGRRCVPPCVTWERKLGSAKTGGANENNVTQIKTPAQIELKTGVIRLGFMLNFRGVNRKFDGVDSDFCAC